MAAAAAASRHDAGRAHRPASGGGHDGLVVAVFSPKGGVGRTTVAVNLAVAAATELGKRVVLVDGSFQFGDVGVLLNLNPKSKSIADLVPELEAGELESLDSFVINHSSGVRVLLAPPSPEMAELVTPAGIKKVLEACASTTTWWSWTAPPIFNDTTLAILDVADMILTMLSLEITSIKNMRLFLEVAEQLGYESREGPSHPEPRRLDARHPRRGCRELDRAQGRRDDRQRRAERRLCAQPWRTVLPVQREAQVSQDILRLARSVIGDRTECRQPATTRPPRPNRRNPCSHGDEHGRSQPLGARRGVRRCPS